MSPPGALDPPSHPTGERLLSRDRLAMPLLLALGAVLTRLPVLLAPKALDDEQVYAVVARQLLAGGRLYIDAIERKPPLLFQVYQVILGVAGPENWFALHLVAVLWTLATMAALGWLVTRLFGSPAGLWAALLYGLFQAWGDYRNLAFNGELMMNLPVVLAFGIALGPTWSRFRPELLLAGALIATAFMLKQPAGIAGLPLGLYVLDPRYRTARGIGWAQGVLQALFLLLGFALVFALVGWLLWRDGILAEAIQWSVLDHAGVPPGTSFRLLLRRAPDALGFFTISTLPLLLGAGLSIRAGLRRAGPWQAHRAEFTALVLLLVVSFVGTGVNGQFLYHYFLQLLPPLTALAAPVFLAAWHGESAGRIRLPGRRGLMLWLGVSMLAFLIVDSVGVWQRRGRSPAATWVRNHSAPSDRIFVWGQGTRFTGMYLDADRLPASRFIASFPLTGHIFGLGHPGEAGQDRVPASRWDDLLDDFARNPPRFIIDTDGVGGRPRYPIAEYPVLHRYLESGYREVHRAADGVIYGRPAQ